LTTSECRGVNVILISTRRLSLPSQRHDKLVNTGRIGVFVGYTSTTKQLRVYSPELGYRFRSSKVFIDEKVKGGSIDLQLRNCISGPQGTLNVMPDRKPRGGPRKEIPGITPSVLALSMPALPDVQSTSQIVIPAFIPPPDVPKLNQNIMNNEDNTVNCEDIASPNAPTYPTQSKTSETEIKSPSSPVLLPSIPVPIVEEVQQDFSGEDGAKPQVAISEQPPSSLPLQEDAPQYFTRSKRKRSISSADEDNRMHKIVRAMIAFYAPEDACRSTDESAFPTNEVSNIKIPKTYLDAIHDSSHAQEW
jgi:hypothetical protein